MESTIRRFASKLGIDKAIFYTSVGRIIQTFGGFVSVILIAKYLTKIEQGFYYTFGSILAIQIFLELGLGGIITQYVAHENTHLNWDKEQQVKGDSKYISRLASLLKFCFKWYSILGILLVIVLVIVGLVYFNRFYISEESVNWTVPWLLLCIGTTMNFLVAPISAFISGLGRVKEIAQYRLWAQVVTMIIIWSGLFFGVKLYVGGIASIAGAFLFLCYILFSYNRKTIITLWRVKVSENVQYMNEIFPYQWKIALSWISGYFIFQLFNPVLFATEGAVVAGQMGMTLAVLNGIQSLSLSWMSTKVPLFSGLIAKNNYSELDSIFNKTLKQATSITGFALVLMLLAIFLIRYFHIVIGKLDIGSRFLDYLPMVLMMIPLFINQFVNAWATYLRCHKQEPYLVNSIAGGILCCLSTVLLGKYFGVIGVTAGYCLLTVCFLPWGYYIFKTKKKVWHGR